MFELKKLQKKVNKKIKKQYHALEERFLGIEDTLYTSLEDRLASLEEKFDRVVDLLEKQAAATAESKPEKSEKKKVKKQKEDSSAESITNKSDKSETLNKETKGGGEKTSSKKAGKKNTAGRISKQKTSVAKRIEKAAARDLTQLRGIGEKMSEQLHANDIHTLAQIAGMTSKDVAAMDKKISSFSARYERYDWGNEAKKLV